MRQKNMPNKEQIRKILIIKGPGIGDVVTAIPLARNFKKFAGCEVHILEEFPPGKQGKVLVKNCPYIDKISRIDYNIWYLRPHSSRFFHELFTLRFIPDAFRFIRDIIKLRSQKYDLVFEGFPGTTNTHFLTKAIGAKHTVCCSSHPRKAAYDIILDIKGKNIVEAENSIFEKFQAGAGQKDLSLELFFDVESYSRTAEKILGENGINETDNIIGINTGQGYKRWQNSKWAELIGRMSGVKVVLLGDAGQSPAAKEITALSKKDTTDLTGKLTLEETTAVMSRLRLFICANGGLMWLSAALGLPTVVVSGPTPYWWDPRAQNCRVVRKAGKNFYEQQEYSWLQQARTDDVTVEDVVSAINDLGRKHKVN